MSGRRLLKILLAIALIAGLHLFFTSGALNFYFVRILMLCCFSVMLAVSLNIINGYAGQFSIGHAGFYAIGAYTSASFSVYAAPALGLGYDGPVGVLVLLLAIAVGALASGFAGYLVGLPTLRLRGDYLAIATLGFGEVIRVMLINIEAVGGSRGFSGIPNLSSYFWILFFTVGIVWLSRNLLNSRQGRAMHAVRDDETAASVLGIDVTRSKVMAFALSSCLAGVAGALFAHYDGFLLPSQFDFFRSIEIIIMVVLGGLGSTTGAIIAAVFLTILPESLRGFSDYRMLVYSFLLVVTMLVRPQGLLGTREFSLAMLRGLRKEGKRG